MTDHVWTVVAVLRVGTERGAEIAAMDLPERLARLGELFPATTDNAILSDVVALRGPICSECRVDWRDVYAQPDKPWPCRGRRPKALGGPLVPPEKRLTRQQRRAQQRAAAKAGA